MTAEPAPPGRRADLHIGVTPWLQGSDGLADSLADQAELAEQLGFDSLWLPESHFIGPGAIPAPLLLLAAVASRTRRIGVATTSYLLPLRHPLHVAAEVAVLDRLSRGRVILGVGRGFRSATFAAFGVPAREKRDRFEAALAAMRRAWRGEPVAWDEAVGDAPAAPVRLAPLPVQKPHPPIWVAAFGPKAVAQAGRLGLPYLASPIETLATLEANYARHRDAREAAGQTGPLAVPVMRTVFASRDAALLRGVREALAAQAAALAKVSAPNLRRAAGAPIEDWALVGEPEAVAEGVHRYREKLGITHLIVRAQLPGASPEALVDSLRLLAALER